MALGRAAERQNVRLQRVVLHLEIEAPNAAFVRQQRMDGVILVRLQHVAEHCEDHGESRDALKAVIDVQPFSSRMKNDGTHEGVGCGEFEFPVELRYLKWRIRRRFVSGRLIVIGLGIEAEFAECGDEIFQQAGLLTLGPAIVALNSRRLERSEAQKIANTHCL